MAKDNKNMVIGIVVAAVVVIAIIIGVIVGINSGNNSGQSSEPGPEESSNEVDYSNINVSVGYGDYDVMEAQAQAIANGEMLGQIVQIDGIVEHPMSKYSIVEPNEDGTKKVGVEFMIEGLDESQYPQDGEHIVMTGEVIEKEPLYYIIKTTPEYIDILGMIDEEVNE